MVPDMGEVSRRSFLGASAGAILAARLGAATLAASPATVPTRTTSSLPSGLFSLGIASGEPLPDSVVLWTRLAPDPLNGGGMPNRYVAVKWEVATDDSFRHVVRRGTALAAPENGHAVHVDVRGLKPGREYAYRFRAGADISSIGRTLTAPPPGRHADLRFVFASCQNWKDGFWPAWGHAASQYPDLVVHLGDYIYESGQDPTAIRDHNGPEVKSLLDYRNRYALYKSDLLLQIAHAIAPWIVTWDDHEVENNYAGLEPQDPADAPTFAARRAVAYKAWWEHSPVRLPAPTGPDLAIYRSLDWGRLARFHVLDGRQYRSDQPCGSEDLGPTCPERTAPDRTMLGTAQQRWLGRSLRWSRATWDVLANQVVMTSLPLGGAVYNHDQWDGYAAARQRLLRQLRRAGTDNAVVITGDIHAAGVAGLVGENPDGTPSTEVLGTELVGTSISSQFPPDLVEIAEDLIGALPHVEWVDARHRGYTLCEVGRDQFLAHYEQVQDPLDPASPVLRAKSWAIEAGTPGVHAS